MASALVATTRLVDATPQDDKAVAARCQVALQLATALDSAVESDELRAAAAISKELRTVIDDIASVEGVKAQIRADIFGK